MPPNPPSNAHGFAMRSMPLRDMQIPKSEKKNSWPPPPPSQILGTPLVIYTGRFIKNQQKYTKLLQLFTSVWRNKSKERKGEKKIHQDVVYTT